MSDARPYESGSFTVDAAWASVLYLDNVEYGHTYAVRLRAENINWRVIVSGMAGDEIIASGSIVARAVVRPTLPVVPGGTGLRVEVQSTASTSAVQAEVAWIING